MKQEIIGTIHMNGSDESLMVVRQIAPVPSEGEEMVCIHTMQHLIKVIGTLNEKQLQFAINMEMLSEKRWSILERLHQRYNRLVSERQRQMLKDGGMLI